MRFAFIDAEKAHFPVSFMCRKLQVSRQGYYAWRRREPSEHEKRDKQLSIAISAIHTEFKGVYGSPRITDELKDHGEHVSRKRVARLMREQDLTGELPKRFRRTTDSEHDLPVAPNLVDRRFDVERPDLVWVGDITYIRTWEGWMYLAVVIDLFSRRVIGWAAADHMRTELATEALTKAVDLRGQPLDVIHHSDRGSQYASEAYQALLDKYGMRCSMSRKADCWDNAVAESFFKTIKNELIHRRPWPTRAAARMAIAEYIDGFYNCRRRHSTLGSMSPLEYEMINCQQMLAA